MGASQRPSAPWPGPFLSPPAPSQHQLILPFQNKSPRPPGAEASGGEEAALRRPASHTQRARPLCASQRPRGRASRKRARGGRRQGQRAHSDRQEALTGPGPPQPCRRPGPGGAAAAGGRGSPKRWPQKRPPPPVGHKEMEGTVLPAGPPPADLPKKEPQAWREPGSAGARLLGLAWSVGFCLEIGNWAGGGHLGAREGVFLDHLQEAWTGGVPAVSPAVRPGSSAVQGWLASGGSLSSLLSLHFDGPLCPASWGRDSPPRWRSRGVPQKCRRWQRLGT